jgi:ABC-type methionine transport system ATPase subunit
MDNANINRSDIILRANNLTRAIASDTGFRNIIKSFSFSFERGRIFTVVGPSGSGKTSLLRLFNRLDEKSGGAIYFNDRPIEQYPATELRKKIALAFQIPYLFPGTISSNLTYCCPEKSSTEEDITDRFLKLVGLDEEIAGYDPEKLSVGQKQRVALARSLAMEPEILLLDEPTSSLDPGSSRTIEELIIDLNRKLHLTIIMVTHNFRQAQRLNGDSLLLIDGSLIEWGSSRELFTDPENDIARRFVRGELR